MVISRRSAIIARGGDRSHPAGEDHQRFSVGTRTRIGRSRDCAENSRYSGNIEIPGSFVPWNPIPRIPASSENSPAKFPFKGIQKAPADAEPRRSDSGPSALSPRPISPEIPRTCEPLIARPASRAIVRRRKPRLESTRWRAILRGPTPGKGWRPRSSIDRAGWGLANEPPASQVAWAEALLKVWVPILSAPSQPLERPGNRSPSGAPSDVEAGGEYTHARAILIIAGQS